MFYGTLRDKIQPFPDGEMAKLPTKTVGISFFLVFGPQKFASEKSRGMGTPPESPKSQNTPDLSVSEQDKKFLKI